MRWIVMLVLMGVVAAGCAPSGARPDGGNRVGDPPRGPQDRLELPVAAITLYASGIAYVEHRGVAPADAALQFRFKSSQLDGVLKRMVVQVGDERRPAAIIQPLDKPAAQSAQARRIELSANSTFATLLEQLRGAPIRLVCARETLDATILSLEKKEVTAGDKRIESQHLNVLSGGAIRAVPLESVLRVELSDARLRQELNRAIEGLWQTADDDRTSIAIRSPGTASGARVRVAYTMESPAWKAGYRLMLSDHPRLQAWATVTNDMECDWDRVQLNLMCGRPLVAELSSATDPATTDRAARGPGVSAGESLRWPKAAPSRDALDAELALVEKPAVALDRRTGPGPTIDSSTAFHYGTQVTVPRRSTATILVMDDAVSVERVAVYNEKKLRGNPLLGARLRNTTRQYLLQGPVAVLDDGRFAGDGSLDNLAPGRVGLLTWGIDLPVLIDATQVTHAAALVAGRIESGVLSLSRRHVYTQQYTADNEDHKDRKLIIEHPVRRGYALLEPERPLETTESLYRFEVSAPAGKRVTLVVKEQATELESIDLRSADAEMLLSYAQSTELSQPVREALAKAAAIKRRADEAAPRKAQPAPDSARPGDLPLEPSRKTDGPVMDTTSGDGPTSRGGDRVINPTTDSDQPRGPDNKARKDLEDYLRQLNAQ